MQRAIDESEFKIESHWIEDNPKNNSTSEMKVRFRIVEKSSPNVELGTLVESVPMDSLVERFQYNIAI